MSLLCKVLTGCLDNYFSIYTYCEAFGSLRSGCLAACKCLVLVYIICILRYNFTIGLQSTLLRNRSFYIVYFTGPFWVCATLTFCIGIAGNVADFFHRSGLDFVWKYDFHKGEADPCKSKITIVVLCLSVEEAMFCHKAVIVVLQPLRFFLVIIPDNEAYP